MFEESEKHIFNFSVYEAEVMLSFDVAFALFARRCGEIEIRIKLALWLIFVVSSSHHASSTCTQDPRSPNNGVQPDSFNSYSLFSAERTMDHPNVQILV